MRRLGGTARIWRTDRLATVIVPGTRDVQPSFAPVAKHYGAVVEPCPPRRGNRKGSVESSVRYLGRWWRTMTARHPRRRSVAGQVLRRPGRCPANAAPPAGARTTVGRAGRRRAAAGAAAAPFPATIIVSRRVVAAERDGRVPRELLLGAARPGRRDGVAAPPASAPRRSRSHTAAGALAGHAPARPGRRGNPRPHRRAPRRAGDRWCCPHSPPPGHATRKANRPPGPAGPGRGGPAARRRGRDVTVDLAATTPSWSKATAMSDASIYQQAPRPPGLPAPDRRRRGPARRTRPRRRGKPRPHRLPRTAPRRRGHRHRRPPPGQPGTVRLAALTVAA